MIGKFLLMFLFSSILLVTNGQRIPEGLYVSCANAVVRQSCSAALDLAFTEGRIRRFTTARQYIQTKGCKLSWWVDTGILRIAQKEALQGALQQIDDYCTANGVSVINPTNLPGRGVYVGQMVGNQYAVLRAEMGAFA
uniref:Secreted protein n=1 Tax=Phakopsora pachyrhizi TaxID=170000 RepID=A0A0S1MI85_PHAPC